MPRPASIMSRSLQRRAKWSSHDQSVGSSRGLIANGEFRWNRLLRALPTIPGSASGRTWLGQTNPQLACELPPARRPRSIKVTCQPDRIK